MKFLSILFIVPLLDKHVSDGFAFQSSSLVSKKSVNYYHRSGMGRMVVGLSAQQQQQEEEEEEKGVLDALQPWKIDIPEEYREEILQAEANTQAAKDRGQRIAIYLTLTVICATLAFANAFLTTVRGEDPDALRNFGILWVQENPITNFFLLNGLGGALALIVAGVCGTTAELEQRSRNDNAERIWKELNRRKEETSKQSSKQRKKLNKQGKKKGLKQKKRLAALSEVIVEEKNEPEPEPVPVPEEVVEEEKKVKKEDGIFGKMKDLYKQADSMAASQALLLNKELEDRGVIDKITDESGLRVVGKEEAAKLKQQNVEETLKKEE